MGRLYNGGELVVKVLEEFGARVVFGVLKPEVYGG